MAPTPKPQQPQTALGEFLRHQQLKLGLNDFSFARHLRMDRLTLNRLMNGTSLPRIEVLQQIATGLHINTLLLIAISRPDYARNFVRQIQSAKEIQAFLDQSVLLQPEERTAIQRLLLLTSTEYWKELNNGLRTILTLTGSTEGGEDDSPDLVWESGQELIEIFESGAMGDWVKED